MDEETIKLKYSLKIKLSLVFLFVATFFLIAVMILKPNSQSDISMWFLIAIGASLTLLFSYKYMSKVIISDKLYIKRLFSSDVAIKFSEINDVGLFSIQTIKGSFNFKEIENSDLIFEKLKIAINRSLKNGDLDSYPIKGELIVKQVLAAKAIFPSLILSIMLTIFIPANYLFNSSSYITCLIVWMPMYFLIYLYYKRKYTRETAE